MDQRTFYTAHLEWWGDKTGLGNLREYDNASLDILRTLRPLVEQANKEHTEIFRDYIWTYHRQHYDAVFFPDIVNSE